MTLISYRHVVIDEPSDAPNEGELAAIEHALGATLPEDFRDFLSVANGGTLDYVIDVPHPSGNEQISFDTIYSTRPIPGAAGGHFLAELAAERAAKSIPAGVLPFAGDGGGAVAFLDLRNATNGRVLAFVPGLPGWTGRASSDALVVVAESFADFIGRLYIDKDHAQDLIDQAHAEGNGDTAAAIAEWLNIGMPDWRTRLDVPSGFPEEP